MVDPKVIKSKIAEIEDKPYSKSQLFDLITKYKINIAHSEMTAVIKISINGAAIAFNCVNNSDMELVILRCIIHKVTGEYYD